MKLIYKAAVLLSVIFTLSCMSREPWVPEPDYWPHSSWKEDSLENQGMNKESVSSLLYELDMQDLPVESIILIKNGYKVLDIQKSPYEKGIPRNIYSCTKSITSLLVGIAVDKGYIKDLDKPVYSWFPEYNVSDEWKKVTLRHLLNMTGGIAMDPPGHEAGSKPGYELMQRSDNWTEYVLNTSLVYQPEAQFLYSNMSSYLLTAVLHKATGKTPKEMADLYLMTPLGIKNYSWFEVSPEGIESGASSLTLLPEDLAKIGLLVLQKGRWMDQQIISSSWMEESLTEQSVPGNYYSSQWWKDSEGRFAARGSLGQFLVIDSVNNGIAVINSSINNALWDKQTWLYKKIREIFEPGKMSSSPDYQQQWQENILNYVMGDNSGVEAFIGNYYLDDNYLFLEEMNIRWDGERGLLSLKSNYVPGLKMRLIPSDTYDYVYSDIMSYAYRCFTRENKLMVDLRVLSQSINVIFEFKEVGDTLLLHSRHNLSPAAGALSVIKGKTKS